MPFDSNNGAGVAAGFGVVFFIVMGLIELAALGFAIYMYTRVAGKAGYPKAYGLLTLIPVANLVFIIMFVFQEWPIERRLREAEQALVGRGGMLPPGTPQYAMPGATGYQFPQPMAQPPAPGWSGPQGPTPTSDQYGRPGTPDPYGQPGPSDPYRTDGGH